MTLQEMIKKFQIVPGPTAGTIKVAGITKPTQSDLEQIRSAKAEILAVFAAETEVKAARAAKIASIPGLSELKQAISANEIERAARERSHKSEDCRQPKQLADVTAIATKFPVAAIWIKSEGFVCAANDRKYAAGKKAQEMILAGQIEQAAKVMAAWAENIEID